MALVACFSLPIQYELAISQNPTMVPIQRRNTRKRGIEQTYRLADGVNLVLTATRKLTADELRAALLNAVETIGAEAA